MDTMTKYLVLKMGKRGFTLVSIHPAGHLREAGASASHTANTGDKHPCVIAQVVSVVNANEPVLTSPNPAKREEKK